MTSPSTIDLQLNTYEKLYFQHDTTRRENQEALLQSLQTLNDDVSCCLTTDKNAYDNAKEIFRNKFNIFKRIFSREASRYKTYSVRPLKHVYFRRRDLKYKIVQLVNETVNETTPMEMRSHWNGSIAVVYNPITGRGEWRQYWHGGIHGVFNPITREIEWQVEQNTGVYGVFNPKLNIVEWKKVHKGGVHGVYNPSTNDIEWQTSFNSGIGGVYNPHTKEVEWKTSFNGGVVGYFDYKTETVKWFSKWRHGLALIIWDSTLNTYLTTSSCGWYGDK